MRGEGLGAGHAKTVEEARLRAMQAVEYYNAAVLGGTARPDQQFKQPNVQDPAYKSLGSVFSQKESPPRESKKKLNSNVSVPANSAPAVKSARSVQNMAERSFSVSENRNHSGVSRTPHRVAGYGGAGQPSRGPHRFGHPDTRASYSERLSSRQRANYRGPQTPGQQDMYKSNSSLDLDHETEILQESNVVGGRREYGSHGSLDVMGRDRETLLAMFPASSGEGPAAVSTLTRPNHYNHASHLNRSEESNGSVVSNGSQDHTEIDSTSSPKQKKKAIGFWGNKDKNSRKSQKSLFKKRTKEGGEGINKSVESASDIIDNRAEDKHRRRFFSHHDIGSVCASLSVTAQLRTLQRRNTTTGASAASAALRNSGGGESPDSEEADQGDGVSNDLVLSCPYFRNEIGGEQEKQIALTRETGKCWGMADDGSERNKQTCHTPKQARGFCLLEHNSTHWKSGICPYSCVTSNPVVERTDTGSTYYKNFFYGKEHQNWFGVDENLGPVAVSIRRERVVHTSEEGRVLSHHPSLEHFMYRLIVRTSELLPLRGSVLEDSIPALKSEKIKNIPTKEVLEFCFPELQLSSLHLGIQSGPCEEQLVRLDEQCNEKTYKVGVMYCRAGQQTEEEMYNNEEGGPAFNEFLDVIGQRVRLKGFNKYKAGLCNKNDSTGLYSVYNDFEGNEIMFHVSTLLPYTPNNRQQLPRKRHIGNDIVTVVFQEPGALPFIPNIRSQFQHVFIIVRAHNPCTENTQYSVAVTRSKNVPMFGPPIPAGALFTKSSSFTKFILTKVINAENAAHRSDKFVSMATRTRQEYLKDLATNYSTQTTIDSGSKFAIFAPKKKLSIRPRFSPDASLRGALSWAIVIEDCSNNQQVEAFVAVSSDTLVIIQDNTHRDILFITPCKSILGWSATNNSIRIFYHQGECVIIHSKDWEADDMAEISARLKSVTPGAASQEFSLRRNQLGQLGFHVQHDGLITEVENFGYAWQTGLRQGSRLVEICKHPVTTLTHEQMVDLLKTSMTVTVTVIPPHPDGSPRQGCNLANCSYAFGGFEGDYENVSGDGDKTSIKQGAIQAPSNGKMRYERSLSPPRSSSSSGYGTGSSSKSFMECGSRFPVNNAEGTMTSSSSGHSSDERWYDFMDQPPSTNNSPPPLPTRIGSKSSAFQKVSQGHRKHSQPEESTKRDSPNMPSSKSTEAFPVFSSYATPPVNPQMRGCNGYESASSSDTVKSSSTIHIADSNNANTHLHEEKYSSEARSTYLTDYELNNNRSSVESEKEHFTHAREQVSVETDLNSQEREQQSHERDQFCKEYLQHERLSALKPSNQPVIQQPVAQQSVIQQSSPPQISIQQSVLQQTSIQQSVIQSVNHSVSLPSEQRQLTPSLSNFHLDGHTTDSSTTSERLGPVTSVRSEDELSGASSHSPQRPRQGSRRNTTGTTTPSSTASTGSRGHSPRTINGLQLPEPAKKKVARSARNSANLASSTLQEDLMKLISPDYDDTTNKGQSTVQDSPLSKLPKKTLSELSLMKSRSRENIARLEDTVSAEVSFHMARPATVISNASTTSSPAADKNLSSLSTTSANDSRNSPHVSSVNIKAKVSPTVSKAPVKVSGASESGASLPLSDGKGPASDMDWTSLVDTATKAIYSSPDNSPVPHENSSSSSNDTHVQSVKLTGAKEEEVRALLERVASLEEELQGEKKGKVELEHQVQQLKEENVRLQEESQTAAQQLRRFTEWFFQTIDKS